MERDKKSKNVTVLEKVIVQASTICASMLTPRLGRLFLSSDSSSSSRISLFGLMIFMQLTINFFYGYQIFFFFATTCTQGLI